MLLPATTTRKKRKTKNRSSPKIFLKNFETRRLLGEFFFLCSFLGIKKPAPRGGPGNSLQSYFFLAAGFLATVFFAAGFLAVVFFGAAFLAAGLALAALAALAN